MEIPPVLQEALAALAEAGIQTEVRVEGDQMILRAITPAGISGIADFTVCEMSETPQDCRSVDDWVLDVTLPFRIVARGLKTSLAVGPMLVVSMSRGLVGLLPDLDQVKAQLRTARNQALMLERHWLASQPDQEGGMNVLTRELPLPA